MYSLKNLIEEIDVSFCLIATFFVAEQEANITITAKEKREIFKDIFFKSKYFISKSIEFD
ncbi:hypothetical protein DU508_08995 [Pedobacter chinensis]|uniref:Uncharacterized protein n=1 Tax=Pedobacter chinensis TaxID=2282421 RepID=A0A369Q221_9SPHI|nr:hypothetical protein DU508_08995 [Pedobacter chinensis]